MRLRHEITPPFFCDPSGAPEFIPGFQWGSCYSIFSFICMFCRLLFVLLYFLFWPLCCLFSFDIRILIAPLVFANSSVYIHFFINTSLFPLLNVFASIFPCNLMVTRALHVPVLYSYIIHTTVDNKSRGPAYAHCCYNKQVLVSNKQRRAKMLFST